MMEPKKTIEEITMDYMDDLAGMGYPTKWRVNVLLSAPIQEVLLWGKTQGGMQHIPGKKKEEANLETNVVPESER